jgi:hypothetical protein
MYAKYEKDKEKENKGKEFGYNKHQLTNLLTRAIHAVECTS